MSGVGTPTWTKVPARSRAMNACSITAGWPTASMQTSAPLPPVRARIASTGSPAPASTVCVAPKEVASWSFPGSRSTPMMVAAPASFDPATAAHPTPPQPKTATESPSPTWPVNMAAPSPAMTPQPEQSHGLGPRRRIDLRALARRHQGLLGERADAQGGGERGAVGQRHLLRGVVGGEAVPRPPPPACSALAAHGPPIEDDEVPGRQVRDGRADRLDDAGRLVAEQEGEVVVDAALAVVQVRVAHAAGLDGDHRLAGTGVGHDDRLERDRRPLLPRHHPTHLLSHAGTSPSASPHDARSAGGARRCWPTAMGPIVTRHARGLRRPSRRLDPPRRARPRPLRHPRGVPSP